MGNSKTNLYIPIIFFLLLSPASVLGQETETSRRIPVAAKGNFVLSVENDRLSLKGQEASLQAILAEIGQKMGIEVVGEIPPEAIVTTEFYNLPLEQALQDLSPNYGYQMDSREGKRITKIFVLPKGKEITSLKSTASAPESVRKSNPSPEPQQIEVNVTGKDDKKEDRRNQSMPFHFEFDPFEFMKKEKER